jgi:hypothetical protein
VDGAQALSYLKKFGSVTVLNSHIHQVLQKVEGKVSFPAHAPPRTHSRRLEQRSALARWWCQLAS